MSHNKAVLPSSGGPPPLKSCTSLKPAVLSFYNSTVSIKQLHLADVILTYSEDLFRIYANDFVTAEGFAVTLAWKSPEF